MRHLRNSDQEQAEGRASRGRRFAGGPSADILSRRNALPYYAKKRASARRGRVLRGILAGVAVLLVAAVVGVWGYIISINGKLGAGVSSELRSVLTETKYNEPFYMLLLGVDKDEERTQDSQYGADSSNYRTDTIILARMDPQNKKVTLVSIPRDTYVDLGVNGKQKINAAYSYGGAAYATKVVSEFAGVSISHYAEVDMDGFAAIVDQVGGVTVDLPVDVKDPDYTGLDLPAGENTLDGQTAALLGRTRHAYDNYGGGDFYRAANQRMLIGAVTKKVLSSDPITMANTVSTMAGYVTTDLDVSSIAGLASQFIGMDVDEDIYSGLCPTTAKYMNDLWYEICDTAAWKVMMDRVDQGLPPYSDASQDTTAGVAGSVGKSSGGDSVTASSASEEPVYSGNVSVLNASGKNGAAGNAANKLVGAGFSAIAGNADSNSDTTRVIYNASSSAKARGAARTLGLDDSIIEENDGSWNSSVDVVVVLGSDYKS